MSFNPTLYKEYIHLRKTLGFLIAKNRQLFPLPPGIPSSIGTMFGPTHPNGEILFEDLESRNDRLRMKIISTTQSNLTKDL